MVGLWVDVTPRHRQFVRYLHSASCKNIRINIFYNLMSKFKIPEQNDTFVGMNTKHITDKERK